MDFTENDYLVRATAAEGSIRAFAASTRDTVEEARRIHGTSPVVTAALGRLLTAALMMGSDMKGEKDLVTLKINCGGPVKSLLVTADKDGNVKGCPGEPCVLIPANDRGKLDVAGALGPGVLTVIKDIGLKEPYSGQTMLVSGEIAEDLTYYFASSEQVPSSVSLGVLMNRENTVRQAGGFILQLMPGAGEEVVSALEKKIEGLKSMTRMLDEGMKPEEILCYVLEGMNPEINARMGVRYHCGCCRDRVSAALISLGKQQLEELASTGENTEVACQFCDRKYSFSPEELKGLIG